MRVRTFHLISRVVVVEVLVCWRVRLLVLEMLFGSFSCGCAALVDGVVMWDVVDCTF